MLEQFVKGWGVYYTIAALCLLGAVTKVHESRVYRRLYRAAQEPERTEQPFMKQICLKYKSYYRLEHQVHNIEAFIENHLYRYKLHGIRLERLRSISSGMMLLCVMATCIGVAICIGNDLGGKSLMYHIVAGASAVALLEWIDVQTGADSWRNMLISALKDYLENVLANNLEREPAAEVLQEKKPKRDKQLSKKEKKQIKQMEEAAVASDVDEVTITKEKEEEAELARLEEAIAQMTADNAEKRLALAQEKLIADVIKEFFP